MQADRVVAVARPRVLRGETPHTRVIPPRPEVVEAGIGIDLLAAVAVVDGGGAGSCQLVAEG